MNRKEMDEAVKMITSARREGKDIAECTRMLASAGFTHEEIERVMEESDKLM